MKLSRTISAPQAEYDLILSDGCCTHRAVKAIKRVIDQSDFKRILLDGFFITGVAVRACLGDRFVGFVDTSSINLIREHRFL